MLNMEDRDALLRRISQLEDELERVRHTEQDLTDFIEKVSSGLHWADPDGIIVWANQGELDLLGYTKEEYVGQHMANFHADQEVIADMMRRLAEGETLLNYEARLRARDGSIKHVLINSNVCWQGEKFLHTRFFTRDVSARKEVEDAFIAR
jgi:PAS domain S-box-containing protein